MGHPSFSHLLANSGAHPGRCGDFFTQPPRFLVLLSPWWLTVKASRGVIPSISGERDGSTYADCADVCLTASDS